jgi:hypothetical protein
MKRIVLFCLTFAAALGVAAVAYSESQENLIRRYPFDPACPWGRIANGKGMIVRCLGDQEAAALARAPDPNAPASVPSATPAASAAPSSSAPAASASAAAPTSAPSDFDVSVGPIVADKGKLELGKLSAPKDRYKKCVLDNGGLKGESGEVQIRFMVMTKGIAEGVTVHKRMNVSSEAARCVADIVDRRRVSVPEEPMVGATVFIKFGKGAE